LAPDIPMLCQGQGGEPAIVLAKFRGLGRSPVKFFRSVCPLNDISAV